MHAWREKKTEINSKRQRGQRPRFEGLIFIFPPCLYSFMLLFSRRPEKWKATCLFIRPCASLWGFSGPGLCMGVSPEPGSSPSSHWITQWTFCIAKLQRNPGETETHRNSCFHCRLGHQQQHDWPPSTDQSRMSRLRLKATHCRPLVLHWWRLRPTYIYSTKAKMLAHCLSFLVNKSFF